MPRETRSRRLTGPAVRSAPGGGTAARPLISLLARSRKASDLLPSLHQHVVDATGGACSLLFQQNPRNALLQATSGFGLESLHTDPWIPQPEEADVLANAFGRVAPTLIADAARQMPDLAARLDTPAALLLPLMRSEERVGLVAIGFLAPPTLSTVAGDAAEAADAFVAALELMQLRQREDLRRDVHELLAEFSDALSATLNLAAGLDIFCHGASQLFAADRTSVWIHDRRARELVLHASSDPEGIARGLRISTDDTTAPAAVSMRRARAEIVSHSTEESAPARVTVPLRGCRRALGTIVLEGLRFETGGELDLLDRADELGGQLARAIENVQLIDELMRSTPKLEDHFDSISHLVAV